MPVIRIANQNYTKIGGTFEVTGNINISGGLTIELNPSVFNSRGIWTLITWTGTLTGTTSNITLVNNTGFIASAVYQEGNTFKISLS